MRMGQKDFMTKKFMEDLELKELQASSIEIGHPSVQVYGKLLLCYLIHNDLEQAKLLWKRIPAETKKENPELDMVWNMAKMLFTRDLFSIYSSINGQEWPEYLSDMMPYFRDKTVERVINLISSIYTCIHISDIASALNLNESDSIQKITELGWRFSPQDGYVYPLKFEAKKNNEQKFDQSMANLTKYVAFLETN